MTLFVFRKAYPKGQKGIKEESVFKQIESYVQEVYLFYVSLKYTWLTFMMMNWNFCTVEITRICLLYHSLSVQMALKLVCVPRSSDNAVELQ